MYQLYYQVQISEDTNIQELINEIRTRNSNLNISINMIENTEITGTWLETKGTFTAKLPALGIRKTDTGDKIVPVIPGMVLTIDKKSYTKNEKDSLIFHRLFAPVAPHTTAAKGRTCKSCHNNPVALGFGEGDLKYQIKNVKFINILKVIQIIKIYKCHQMEELIH